MQPIMAQQTDSIRPIVVVGSILVACTTPLNLVLLLLCWVLVQESVGNADNRGWLLFLLGVVVNVGLFLALCVIAHLVSRRWSDRRRVIVIVSVFIFHVALWLGMSFAFVAHMAATGVWL